MSFFDCITDTMQASINSTMDDQCLNALMKLHENQFDINKERFEKLVKNLVNFQTKTRKRKMLIKRMRNALKKAKIMERKCHKILRARNKQIRRYQHKYNPKKSD